MSNSKRWLQEHFADEYVKKAQAAGYPSRAVYKLMELQEKYHLMKPGMQIVDLGAAPGGWSMLAKEAVGERGQVFALDILPMEPIMGVDFIQGDFNDQAVLDELLGRVDNQKVDLVLSDMAPNLSGQWSVDQPRSVNLVELALDCANQILRPGGAFLAKIFQGSGVDDLVKQLHEQYGNVKTCKPKASRPRSREIYLLAQDFQIK